ncbi:cold-inducible protein YdjO-related protein [Metabacillus fastidiosus]|uniref:Cold-inducible protein YdjO-related protein n=1 Tax=Metabacillus fastidiosus TaxID=1458 RepID=A0ABU6NST7_9BACI|nr:cold-inducible protein YdjO-related protein [Metabacillus fastidiosus]
MRFQQQVEKPPEVNLKIWKCASDTCKGWMRDNFKSDDEPSCPLCGHAMMESERTLPVIENFSAVTLKKEEQ